MRLTIDTATDSKDDLRRVIRFLQQLVSEKDFRSELRKFEQTDDTSNTSVGEFFGQFDEPPRATSRKETDLKNDFKLDFF